MHEPLIYALVAAVAALGLSSGWRWARLRWRMLEIATTGEQYHAVVEQSPNGVLVADAGTLRVVAANPALLQCLGYSLEELRTRTLADVLTVEGQGAKELLRKLNPRTPIQVHRYTCAARTAATSKWKPPATVSSTASAARSRSPSMT